MSLLWSPLGPQGPVTARHWAGIRRYLVNKPSIVNVFAGVAWPFRIYWVMGLLLGIYICLQSSTQPIKIDINPIRTWGLERLETSQCHHLSFCYRTEALACKPCCLQAPYFVGKMGAHRGFRQRGLEHFWDQHLEDRKLNLGNRQWFLVELSL